ncbi:17985_t:CDS:2, partial [Gigaspora margarita]
LKGEQIVGVTDSIGIIFSGQCRGETTISGSAEVAKVIIIGLIVDGWFEKENGWIKVVNGWAKLVNGSWDEVVVVEIVDDAWDSCIEVVVENQIEVIDDREVVVVD